MYTQNTPVHVRLWHRGFWLLATANLLLTMSVYMLMPALPKWLMSDIKLSAFDTGLIMGSYGIGLFMLGPVCSWLIQRFRRNAVCMYSILVLIVSIFGFLFFEMEYVDLHIGISFFIALRMIMGAVFGLAQMVLSSTLVIDTCESFQRTEANHLTAWFGRFALSLGPLLAIFLLTRFNYTTLYLVSMGLSFIAVVLIESVKFPFKAPDDTMKLLSTDRFFLSQGIRLFINLTIINIVIGMIMTIENTETFYAMIMVGFVLAILSQKYVFVNAELKSEIITGLILLGAAILIMLTRTQTIAEHIAPLLIGLGIGVIGSRFLLFFIKLSRHCQRGTSQSSFFLAWEFGLSIGLFLGYSFFYGDNHTLLLVALSLIVVALLMYNFITHKWYMKHKNR